MPGFGRCRRHNPTYLFRTLNGSNTSTSPCNYWMKFPKAYRASITMMLVSVVLWYGCTGGTVVTAKRASDHVGTFKEFVNDTYLEFLVTKALRSNKELEQRRLTCDVNDRVAVVNGTVPVQDEKEQVTHVVAQVKGLRKIINNVIVSTDQEKYYWDDLKLAYRIRIALIRDRDVKSLPIEVYSNMHRVFLSGIVATRKEEARIITLSEEQGAWKVVSFLIIKPQEVKSNP